MLVTIAAVVMVLMLFMAMLMLNRSQQTINDNIATLLAANSRQLELNINNYFSKVEKTVALMFSDESYYAYDATQEDADTYEKIRKEDIINEKIVDLGLMENFSDFGIVYANDDSVGWISQVTQELFSDGGMYAEFAALTEQDERTQDGWAFGIRRNMDRLWYAKRLNENAVMVVSFYSSELDTVFEYPEQLNGMTIRLLDDDDVILYSNDSKEIGTTLGSDTADLVGDENNTIMQDSTQLVTTNVCSNGWRVCCAVPSDIYTKSAEDMRKFIIAILAVLLLVFYLFALILFRTFSRPVDDMVENLNLRASTDQLSGLFNKITFETMARISIEKSVPKDSGTAIHEREENSGKKTSERDATGGGETIVGSTEQAAVFVMVDIDDFKTVNDTLGHDRGDDAIRVMSELLRSVFGSEYLVGRIGGDEFAAFSVFHVSNLQEAEQTVSRTIERFMQEVHRKFEKTEWGDILISASVGAAVASAAHCSFQELYRSADTAMYDCKTCGRDCSKVILYESAFDGSEHGISDGIGTGED